MRPPSSERCLSPGATTRRVVRGSLLDRGGRYIGRTPHLRGAASPRRARRDARARAGQRVRPAARVAAALVPARDVDLRGGGIRRRRARDRLLGRAAPLRRLHRPRPRGRHRVRRRDRDPRPDARPRRRQSRRGHARRRRLRDGRASRGRARRDRPHAPGDGPRVGGAQLRLRLRGRRHARAAARLRRRACARRWPSRSSAGTATAIPPTPAARRSRSPMRVVHLSHDMEAIGRLFSPEQALEAARDRRDRTYDPALADLFAAHGARLVRAAPRDSSPGTPCSPLEPEPHRMLAGGALDEALTVVADFIDLKSPYMGGHSRRCARARHRRRPRARTGRRRRRRRSAARRSCTTSAPPASRTRSGTSPASLTRTEFDRVELHPMLTEQMLRRSPALAAPQPRRRRAPREVRRLRLPQARCAPTPTISARASSPRPRSTWG